MNADFKQTVFGQLIGQMKGPLTCQQLLLDYTEWRVKIRKIFSELLTVTRIFCRSCKQTIYPLLLVPEKSRFFSETRQRARHIIPNG